MENFPGFFCGTSSAFPVGYVGFEGGLMEQMEVVPASLNLHTDMIPQNKRYFGDENNNVDALAVGTTTEMKSSKMKGSDHKKIRKPRYAFQTRTHVDILDDGYRWRKYGQKAVKNNKFPRSYYRCTHQGCNVKKQIQRLTKDEGMVVTTYEGMHSHPIQKSTDNFEHILGQMQIYTSF